MLSACSPVVGLSAGSSTDTQHNCLDLLIVVVSVLNGGLLDVSKPHSSQRIKY